MRPAAAAVAVGLALAVGAPTAWVVTRPDAAAGPSLEQALPAPAVPPTALPERADPPSVGVRDASPAAEPGSPPPVRVELPGLGAGAPLDAVGVTDDGQMALPEDVGRVGWYRFGPRPGEAGNAVLAGHVDDAEQGAGALFRLREIAPGDEVTVTDDAGITTRWRVVSRELLHKETLPVETLFARAGPPRLVLITCGGPFLPEYRSYRDNVVVVAEPVVGSAP
ncbi:class F sortase [Blastococcus xanthinilyticus]|uniref:Sortase family protein n=1 Tax=Blastococcus xanthinilyticus TaxID=1564164 RepID=A0A5S5CKC0_9ACTN|nr:class F sortase [Blastococcus xanthinilyticus]TYP80641.1 sortase family protein [Blastococcus xanthinilyticus]